MAVPQFQFAQWGESVGNSLGGALAERSHRNALADLVPRASAGDPDAQNRLLALDPRVASYVNDMNRQRQTDAATKAKERQALVRQDLIDTAGMIVNMPEADLPNAWGGIRAGLIQRNPELVDRLPEQYEPGVLATARGLVGYKPDMPKPLSPTDDIQEFQFAQQNGFGGTFEQWMARKAQQSAGASPYFQAVPTPQGYMRFNARSGQMEPILVNGAVPQPIAADPTLKFNMEQAGASGRTLGEASAEGILTAPQAIARADQILGDIDNTLKAPGLSTATGLSGTLDPRNYIPGTEARDARVRIDQVQGQAFLQAFESLKGGGAITEREGQAATAAFARLNRAQSDAEFRAALNELKGIIGVARARAVKKGSGALPQGQAPAPSPQPNETPAAPVSVDSILEKYGVR